MTRTRTYLLYSCTSAFMLISFFTIHAQNLVPNPSFEIYTNCPDWWYDYGEPLDCIPWVQGNGASSDFLHQCNGGDLGVPQSYYGYEPAHTGVGYTGMFLHAWHDDYREYIQAPLDEPLQAGVGYYVSFFVSMPEEVCAVRPIGAYFSSAPPSYNYIYYIDVQPQIFTNGPYLDNTNGWTEIAGCFTAQGGESFITIGNFLPDSLTVIDPTCPLNTEIAYYFVDDVTVERMDVGTLPLELGDPVTACYEYEIDPGLDDFHFQWEDGTSNPTLTVTQSGTYALTISEGCNLGIDSIEVTILGAPEVMLPPDSVICEGESITISLDPDAGDYTWQDGSNDPEMVITETGLYQVALDDQCDVTTDEIYVEVVPLPEPFSLGPDVLLCEGEELHFDFDPDLGEFHWQDNNSSNVYTIETAGEYSLTISNMCGGISDGIVVTYLEPPMLEFPFAETELCIGDTLVLSPDPELGAYTWHDGSTEPYYIITTAGDYSATVTNLCGTSSDEISIDLIQPPLIELGEDQVLCSAQLPYTLDTGNDPFAWDYNWQDGSGESFFPVTASGIYSVTVSNTCFSVIDVVEILVLDSALVVQLPDDLVLCPGDSLILSVGGVNGNYTWQDMSTSSTYIVFNPGVYHVAVANDCGIGSDTIIISPAEVVSVPILGPDLNLCPGDSIVLHLNDPLASYLWQDGSTLDSFVVTAAGTYSVTASNSCGALSDTIDVTLNSQPPVLALPDNITLCQGQSVILESGISGVSYLWSDLSSGSSLTVNTAGVYSLTVSNSCGTTSDQVNVIDGGPAPQVDLGNDLDLCPGEIHTLSPAFTNVDAWLWNTGETTPDIDITGGEMVSVIVSNGCGTAYDTLIATLLPAIPIFSLGNDTAVCANEIVTLTVSVPNVDITWSDGSNNAALPVSNPGQYHATITNACGSYSDTIRISLLPAIPPLDLGNDQTLCPGELIVIDPGIPNVNYLWQDGSTGTTYATTQPGSVSLIISNACGTSTDNLEIVESTDGPDVDLGADITGCINETITISSGISGVSYLWHDGSVQSTFTTSVSGEYALTVSNNCGSDADTILVELNGLPPAVDLGLDTMLCAGETLLLEVNALPQTDVLWQDGSILQSFEATVAGVYHVQLTNECGSGVDSIEVAYENPPAAFSLGMDTMICDGESIVLSAPSTSDAIQWQDGSSSPTFIADQSQVYSLQISNQCGITYDEMQLTLIDEAFSINLDPLISWCPERTLNINVEQPFPATYLWNTGATTPTLSIASPGTYSISIQTNCATASGSFDVIPDDACYSKTIYFIPNIFSPNGDGINDIFTVQFNEDADVLSMEGTIFDRWGNVLFASTDNPFAWNGKRNDDAMNPGVYVYSFKFVFLRNGILTEEYVTGDVTLMK